MKNKEKNLNGSPALSAIRFYQRRISPLFPPMCRYYPTCSQYTYEAIEKYGFIIGSFLGFRRIMRCNVFWPGGVDPVPELKEKYRKDRRRRRPDSDPGGASEAEPEQSGDNTRATDLSEDNQ